MADVFISYSRKDKAFVQRLDAALQVRKREAWVDWEGIRPTEEFMQAIYSAIESADTFVFVLTPDSIASVVCGKEIAHAAAHNKRMVPLVARDVDAAAVPEALARLNWIFCRDADDFEKAIDTLVTAFDTDLEWVHAHTRLLTLAVEWESKAKNKSFVLHGDDLRDAEQWLAQAGTDKERQPTALQTEYIIASRKAETARQRTIRTWVAIAAVISIVLAVAAVIQARIATKERDQAQQLLSNSFLSRAQELFEKDEAPSAIAVLAKAIDDVPGYADVAGERLWFALTERAWPLPITAEMKHPKPIAAACFSPDGTQVLTVSQDSSPRHADDGSAISQDISAQLWDAATGVAIGPPMHHARKIREALFSPDGSRVFTASGDATGQLWDAATAAKPVPDWSVKQDNSLSAAAFSPGGRYIATGSQDKKARVWDSADRRPFADRKPIAVLGPLEGNVYALAFHPTDDRLLLTVCGKVARLWKLPEGSTELAAGQGVPLEHAEDISAARFNPAGDQIVTCGKNGTVRVWKNISTGSPVSEPLVADALKDRGVSDVRFSPNGEFIAAAAADSVFLWKAGDHTLLVGAPLKAGSEVLSMCFSPDSLRLFSGSADGRGQVWNVLTGARIGEPIRENESVTAVEFSPDGRRLLLASHSGVARIWQAPAPQPTSEAWLQGATIKALAINFDRRLLVAACVGGHARVWDLKKRTAVRDLSRDTADVLSAAFSPDGKYIVTGSATGNDDARARVWLTDSGELVGEIPHHDDVCLVRFNPDSRSFATATISGSVQIWTVPYLKPLGPAIMHTDRVTGLSFNGDGSLLLTTSNDTKAQLSNARTGEPKVPALKPGGELLCGAFASTGLFATGSAAGSAKIWDSAGNLRFGPLRHKDDVVALAFSPDGGRLATASKDFTGALWNATTGRSSGDAMPHAGTVSDIGFSPDGARVATASEDGSARLWNAETGRPLSEPLWHAGTVTTVAFAPDGRTLFSVSGSQIRVSDIATGLGAEDRKYLAALARALSSAQMESSGRLTPHVVETLSGLQAAAKPPEQTPTAVLREWFFADPTRRALSPFAPTKLRAYIEARIAEGTEDSLNEAAVLAESDAELHKRLEEKRAKLPAGL